MRPVDLSGLIKGLMVVIGIAVALGKLDALKRWAISEAFPNHEVSQTIPKTIHT